MCGDIHDTGDNDNGDNDNNHIDGGNDDDDLGGKKNVIVKSGSNAESRPSIDMYTDYIYYTSPPSPQVWGENWMYSPENYGNTVRILAATAEYINHIDDKFSLDNVMALELLNEPWAHLVSWRARLSCSFYSYVFLFLVLFLFICREMACLQRAVQQIFPSSC